MRLSLLRHGRAEWPAGRYADFDRPLDSVGLREAAAAGTALAQLEPPATLLLHSTALRTTQTAQTASAAFERGTLTLLADPRLYLAGPQQICSVLDELAEAAHHVVIVGHNPGLSELAQRLPGVQSAGLATGQWVSAQLWASARSLSASLFPR